MDLENLFYSRLSQLRGKKGVSARDMSLSLGQSENYINSIENRKNFPSMSGFFYICEYLGIHPRDFFSEDIEDPAMAGEMLEKIQRLDSEKLKHIMAVVDDILEK